MDLVGGGKTLDMAKSVTERFQRKMEKIVITEECSLVFPPIPLLLKLLEPQGEVSPLQVPLLFLGGQLGRGNSVLACVWVVIYVHTMP